MWDLNQIISIDKHMVFIDLNILTNLKKRV
jgi:hypothetical protein